MKTLVSTLIPCYNAEQWIGEAIESALTQTYLPHEVIVFDDGSTDRSLEIIKSFGNRIRWETGPNQGGNSARNRLLELARGDWLQYLDADDYLRADKIAHQMEFVANSCESPDIIFGPVTFEYWSEGSCRQELLTIPEPHDPWVLLASWRLPQTGACLWRKRAIRDVGGWNRGQPCCQEHELYLRFIIGEKRIAYCPNGGAVYRQWSDNTVCRRDIAEVHRRRLMIEQMAEDYLRGSCQLTPERLSAINQARFEIARGAWLYEPALADQILQEIHDSDPQFQPFGPAAPLAYRLVYRWLGFQAVESLAAKKRKVFRNLRSVPT
jgi:glycosyltransferase involved in cell wall biosynthesis